MGVEVRHGKSRQLHDHDRADDALLELPEAQAVIRRLGEAVDPASPIDRVLYVKRVAATVVRAKRRPNNKFAEPTL